MAVGTARSVLCVHHVAPRHLLAVSTLRMQSGSMRWVVIEAVFRGGCLFSQEVLLKCLWMDGMCVVGVCVSGVCMCLQWQHEAGGEGCSSCLFSTDVLSAQALISGLRKCCEEFVLEFEGLRSIWPALSHMKFHFVLLFKD